jgi:hypothetical protein
LDRKMSVHTMGKGGAGQAAEQVARQQGGNKSFSVLILLGEVL